MWQKYLQNHIRYNADIWHLDVSLKKLCNNGSFFRLKNRFFKIKNQKLKKQKKAPIITQYINQQKFCENLKTIQQEEVFEIFLPQDFNPPEMLF